MVYARALFAVVIVATVGASFFMADGPHPSSELGMPSAFGPAAADLTGFTDSPEGSGFYITTIAHKAFVEVNEEGSEAAAATAVVGGFRRAAPAPAMFIANRPFLFAIRHQALGLLLFLGRLTQPPPTE